MSGDLIREEISVSDARAGSTAVEVNKVILSDFKGMVCLTFEKRTDCLTLTAQEALTMSEAMGRQAYRSKFGDFPHGATKQTVEQLRIRARNRVAMMLATKAKEPPKTEKEFQIQATALVDEIMKLVT